MADPFGIKGNSTPPTGMARYHVIFHAVPKPHPAFRNYSGLWTPQGGLVRVMATSESFTDEKDCTRARALYDRVKRQLTQNYGDPASHEFIDDDSIWSDPAEFWQSLDSSERSHSAIWHIQDRALGDGVEQIHLMINSDADYESSHVLLTYSFKGSEEDGPSDEYGLESL